MVRQEIVADETEALEDFFGFEQGTGLGISISYQIVVEKHRGRLYFFNTEQGVTFVIETPVRNKFFLPQPFPKCAIPIKR